MAIPTWGLYDFPERSDSGYQKGRVGRGHRRSAVRPSGGYMHWVIPTFIIKYIMATVMGLFIDKIMPNRKGNWLIGSIVGGIVQIILYTVFKVFLFDWGVCYRRCTGADFADNYRRCSGNSSGGIVQ